MIFKVLTIALLSTFLTAQTTGPSTSSYPSSSAVPPLIGIPANDVQPDWPGWAATKIVDATYPLAARDPNLEGQQVSIRVSIATDGEVESAKGVSGEKVLYDSAIAAVKQWKFEPHLKKGKPAKLSTTIPIRFVSADIITPGTQSSAGVDPSRPAILNWTSAAALLQRLAQPEYPRPAVDARLQGQVRLALWIDKNGTLRELKLISGHPMLVHDAVEAVRQWRFQPFLISGEPVEVQTAVTINFIHNGK